MASVFARSRGTISGSLAAGSEGTSGVNSLGRDGPSTEDAFALLTVLERAVMAASARGLSAVEIAQLLGLPPGTVRASIGMANKKLGATSKLEAVLIVLQQGLIDPPTS
jgi:DNA-binding NarL/FixJ family response regulator